MVMIVKCKDFNFVVNFAFDQCIIRYYSMLDLLRCDQDMLACHIVSTDTLGKLDRAYDKSHLSAFQNYVLCFQATM